jgi:plastocyanin
MAVSFATVLSFVLLQPWDSTPTRAAIVKETHVHDDYYHPAGTFLDPVATNHALAQAACQKATPDPQCTTIINTGDSVRWVAPPPLAANAHSVTECADGSFSVCGAGAAPVNPIEDSGILAQPGWPYQVQFNNQGTFYYRCEVHPDVMRGVVQVNFVAGAVGGIVDVTSSNETARSASTGGDGATHLLAYALATLAGAIAIAGTGYAVRKRITVGRE